MSSLLSNDFEEEYRRYENQVVTNEEAFYIDREGKLIYTTPFSTESVIVDVKDLVLGANQSPENVNLIIDQISLFSTNPNVQNYLPLKFSFGFPDLEGFGKPLVAFGDTDSYTLTDYKIIVEPRVNLDTIQNRRYSSPINYVINANVSVDDVKNVITSQFQDGFATWFLVEQGGNVVYQWFNGIQNTSSLVGITQIYGNNTQAVAVVGGGLTTTIYDLTNNNLIDTINEELIDLFLVNNTMIVATRSGVLMRLTYYVKRSFGQPQNYYKINNVVTNATDVEVVGIYYTNTYYYYGGSGFIEFVTINENNVSIDRQSIEYDFGGEDLIKIYVGGSVIDNPNISIFTYDGVQGLIKWYFFRQGSDQPTIKEFQALLISPQLIKRYRNTAYWWYDFNVYLLNLDNQSFVIYDPDKLTPLAPRQGDASSVVNFTDREFIRAGVSYTEPRNIVWTNFENTRDLRKVFKLSYNYDERVLPYYKPNKFFFSLKLPNDNPVSDLEIFKYVIDYRIRYSKQSIGKPKAMAAPENGVTGIAPNDLEICLESCEGCQGVECEEYREGGEGGCGPNGCPPPTNNNGEETADISLQDRGVKSQREGRCFRHCSRRFGSAARVLGLNLPEDFNIEDFLNIYSTR